MTTLSSVRTALFRPTLAAIPLWRFLRWLVLAVLLFALWRFLSIAVAPLNRPYLARLPVQCAEIAWVLILLTHILRNDQDQCSTAPFERRMLLALWLLYGLWLCWILPLDLSSRSLNLFASADLVRYQRFLPWLPNFRLYLILLWLLGGVASLIVYTWKKRYADLDEVVLPAVMFLVFQGLVLLARLGPDLPKANGMALHQTCCLILAVSVGGLILRPALRERLLQAAEFPYLLLLSVLVLIASTFVIGTALNGGKTLWIVVGGLSFQPVELAKILFVILMATLLDRHAFALQRDRGLAVYVSLSAVCGVFFLLLFLQRDLGPILLLTITVLVMFLTVSRKWLFLLVSIIAAWALRSAILHSHWPSIVYSRLQESIHPSGQLQDGLWAQAAGGLWGSGLGLSRAHGIPIVESDYLFSALIAEKGLIGGLCLLAVFTALAWRGAQLSTMIGRGSQRDGLIMLGLTVTLFTQGFLIIAGNLALIPLTGVTLPFVSAGGTSLVINIAVIYLALALVARNSQAVTTTHQGA